MIRFKRPKSSERVTGPLHGDKGVLVSGRRSAGLVLRAVAYYALDPGNLPAKEMSETLEGNILGYNKKGDPTILEVPRIYVEGVMGVVANYANEIGGPRLQDRAAQLITAIELARREIQPPETP